MKNVVVQQPQFLPWAGLWFKAVSADVYVIYAGVKFDQSDHQHRVTINGHWVTLPIATGQRNRLIKDVKLADGYGAGLRKVAATIRQTCMAKKNRHRERLDHLMAGLEEWGGTSMLDLNVMLHCRMMDALGIRHDLIVDVEVRKGEAIEKLDACLKHHVKEYHRYLAGRGGLDYMGYESLKTPVETRFQKMKPGVPADSVLQSIAQETDPLYAIKHCAEWETKEGDFYEWDNATLARARAAL